MGRKKKRKLSEVEENPGESQAWCFYCDRTFADEAILVQHQKARHFKCTQCNKRFFNSSSLVIHLNHVHKTQISAVPNALEDRCDVKYEVSGMQKLPLDHPAVIEHMRRQVPQMPIPNAGPPPLDVLGVGIGMQPNHNFINFKINSLPIIPPGGMPPPVPLIAPKAVDSSAFKGISIQFMPAKSKPESGDIPRQRV